MSAGGTIVQTENVPTATSVRISWKTRTFILIIGAVLLAGRAPDRLANPQFWAEDGIFFFWARADGIHQLFVPLAGYLQLAPRLIAAIAQAFDPTIAPLVFALAAAVTTIGVMGIALSDRCALPFRPAIALAMVAMPGMGEILLRAGNVIWILAAGYILLLVSEDAQTQAQRVRDCIWSAFFGLSGPFCLLLLPLFVVRAARRRTAASLQLALVALGCSVVQGYFLLTHSPPAPTGTNVNLLAGAAFTGVRLGSLFLGSLWAGRAIGPVVGILLTAAVLGLAGWLAAGAGPYRRTRLCFGITVGLLILSTAVRCRTAFPDLLSPPNGERYFYLPELLLTWLCLARIADARSAIRVGGIVCCGLILFNAVSQLRLGPVPDRHWRDQAAALSQGKAATITINPGPPWTFPFPARP